ncbi:enoyl-CoA hydratase/isomerase family protein [Natronolimnohabitans innermongolicus]|uniref:Enoyl-CoA hydratase/isomerase n=1 Tax=Natronolimnohabitans innermongolicus JCM 12255 TaxID=1227499 RepID=L9WLX1_9EURY|nr:enoyl-CoA hydratase-related protein [Natronolimnohabitans innermongolicus]ELY50465.1 enoyl-CoA hydratase/isomerase [Natronolimnohabitans innermongolicus JCM 12255]
MSTEAVLAEFDDGIATITLNQPDRMNALSDDIKRGLESALDAVEERDDVRCLVLQGNGTAFCAGGDVGGMGDRDESDRTSRDRIKDLVDLCEQVPIRIYEADVPTVAKIDGYCVGAGVGLALSCDLQLASDDASFGLVFRNVGLSLDLATSFLVPRAVGWNVAKELALTGEIIDADRAEALGLINHAYPSDEFEREATELIDTVATGPTVALEQSLRNIDRSYGGTIREASEREAQAQNIAFETADHREGVAAFGEDREPEFQGR